jgi:hypothetical protein
MIKQMNVETPRFLEKIGGTDFAGRDGKYYSGLELN